MGKGCRPAAVGRIAVAFFDHSPPPPQLSCPRTSAQPFASSRAYSRRRRGTSITPHCLQSTSAAPSHVPPPFRDFRVANAPCLRCGPHPAFSSPSGLSSPFPSGLSPQRQHCPSSWCSTAPEEQSIPSFPSRRRPTCPPCATWLRSHHASRRTPAQHPSLCFSLPSCPPEPPPPPATSRSAATWAAATGSTIPI